MIDWSNVLLTALVILGLGVWVDFFMRVYLE